MSEIVVVGSLKARPDQVDEARQVLAGLVEPTHAEAGCILYAMHQGVDDPTRFAFVERWSSKDLLQAHLGSPHIASLLERADELLAEPPDIVVYDAVPGGDERKGRLAATTG